MGVSKNNGTPKSSILIGFSIIIYKPSMLGYPYFWKHPYQLVIAGFLNHQQNGPTWLTIFRTSQPHHRPAPGHTLTCQAQTGATVTTRSLSQCSGTGRTSQIPPSLGFGSMCPNPVVKPQETWQHLLTMHASPLGLQGLVVFWILSA